MYTARTHTLWDGGVCISIVKRIVERTKKMTMAAGDDSGLAGGAPT